jgi:subfamily B ATP-binding cassette protein HlyB/CyaB
MEWRMLTHRGRPDRVLGKLKEGSSGMNAVMDVPRSVDASPADGDAEALAEDLHLQGLVLLAQFHGVAANADQLRHEAGRGSQPFDETALLLAARKLGLKARVIRQPAERLDRVALPALALQHDGQALVVAKVDDPPPWCRPSTMPPRRR